jgi:transposase-like protein
MSLMDNWQRFIPLALRPEAERLVWWLENRPFQQPEDCPYCHSKSFRERVRNGQKRAYQCHYCHKSFSQTTGTLFANTQYAELWGDFARWRFCGLPLKKIAEHLGITVYACRHRDLGIMALMQEEYPALYEWWHAHQERMSREMTPLVEIQRQQFLLWLTEVLARPQAPCPQCSYSSRREGRNSDRPWFFCNPCGKGFSLLAGTPLKGMLYTEIWSSFVDNMLNGESMWHLQHDYHIGTGTLHRWRKNFLAMMQSMGMNELVEWAEWQRSRGYSVARKKRQKGVYSPRPTNSKFNGRGQLK